MMIITIDSHVHNHDEDEDDGDNECSSDFKFQTQSYRRRRHLLSLHYRNHHVEGDHDHADNGGDNYDPHHWQKAGLIPGVALSVSVSTPLNALRTIVQHSVEFRLFVKFFILYFVFCILNVVFCTLYSVCVPL